MVSESLASPGEYRRYRRFLSWLVLCFISLGSIYLLVSVGVTIYRRRHAEPLGAPVGASTDDLESCAEELTDVEQGLERHLDNFSHLVAHYDADEAQRWAEDRDFWLGQWRAAGNRCQYTDPRHGPLAKEWEQLAVIHTDLRDTEQSYTKELIRFGKNEAPQLDLLRERLESVGRRIGASTTGTTTTHDSGDTTP
ncbi:MAG TPA: hypothetical protein VIK30_01940 [Polyangia bacterium]